MTGQALTEVGARSATARGPIRVLLIRLVMSGSLRRAASTAALLDGIVDRDLALVHALPAHLRGRGVERLAVLVMLAQAHRHHAAGWIGRRELRRHALAALEQLTSTVVH